MTPAPATNPARECPRFPRCSVNHCPLDPDQEKHLSHPLDREPKCTIAKSIRLRIGIKYPDLLPMMGLRPKEHSTAMVWSKMTPLQREAKRDHLRATLQKINRQKA